MRVVPPRAGAFYWLNGMLLDAPDDPAYDLVIDAAPGQVDAPHIAKALVAWLRRR